MQDGGFVEIKIPQPEVTALEPIILILKNMKVEIRPSFCKKTLRDVLTVLS
jgi:hypothetical protein